MDYAIVAALLLLVVFTLVAFGVGHKRWSIVSVVASFLLAISVPAYLYFATHLLYQEWRWAEAIRQARAKLTRVRDAQEVSFEKDRRGRLDRIANMWSIRELEEQRDRWQRALTRVENWRGRSWDKASFIPPTAQQPSGTVTLPVAQQEAQPAAAAEDAAELLPEEPAPAQPARIATAVDPGTTVYLFDDAPFEPAGGGGRYLGAFIVQSVEADDQGRQVLSVNPTEAADAYDRSVWNRAYDDTVSVYTELPIDRWLAFSETPVPVAGGPPEPAEIGVAPQPQKRPDKEIEKLLPDDVLRQNVRRHALAADDAREPIAAEQWAALREELKTGAAVTGSYWAEVTFGDREDLLDFLEVDIDEIGDAAGLSIEMDFETAMEKSEGGTVTIDKVFYRRPLLDGLTRIHGSVIGDGIPLVAEGLGAVRLALQREDAALRLAISRLEAGKESLEGEQRLLDAQIGAVEADLERWQKDVEVAERLAHGFEQQLLTAKARLRETEERIVELGRELVAEVAAGMPAARRAGSPPAGRRGTAF